MKTFLLAVPLLGLLAACDTQSQATLGGAAAGAAVGAAVSDGDDRDKGAIVGAAVGAVAGNLLGKTADGDCLYQRPDGSRYRAACP